MESGKWDTFWRNNTVLACILLVVTATAAIVAMMPHDKKNYSYTLNAAWRQESLTAETAFPIYKSSKEYAAELDSTEHSFAPYFNYNKDLGGVMFRNFHSDYVEKLVGSVPHDYFNYIKRKLNEVYANGIISLSDVDTLVAGDFKEIMVVNDKSCHRIEYGQFFTNKTAYEHIIYGDTLNFNPDILRRCNLSSYLQPNLTYDFKRSKMEHDELMKTVSETCGIVQAGETFIQKGQIVDKQKANIIESYNKFLDTRSTSRVSFIAILGQMLFIIIVLGTFTFYLRMFRSDYYESPRDMALLYFMIIFFPILTSLMVSHSHNEISVYAIPYAAAPMMVRVFLDSRTAFITHITTILICSIAMEAPNEFFMIQCVAGITAILSVKELSRRTQLFLAAGFVVVSMAVTYTAYELMHVEDINKIATDMYLKIAIMGALLLFVYVIMLLVEKALGYTSDITLIELSTLNNNIMRELSNKAPGTFQHSTQVSNLAAEIANRIGGKSLLVRTGALYHDIGKMENPEMFIENQAGTYNPHKSLNYEQSAEIIINHVSNGMKIANREHLPMEVKNFILTHHGRSKARYFYTMFKNENPDAEIDESKFTYPGPNPFTLEQAIVMMADSVEAASRSLSEYSEESINELVDRIIGGLVSDGCFVNCPITFAQITMAKGVLKEKLKTTYHTRIVYPEMKVKAKEEKPQEPADEQEPENEQVSTEAQENTESK